MATRFRPIHGAALLLAVMAGVFFLERALAGRTQFERVMPAPDGTVHISLTGLEPGQVRFYQFLNRSNQEVRFFAGRDHDGAVQVAFDASESDYKRKRGFRLEGEWLVNNKCETAGRLAEVNRGGGGCRPVPLRHRVEGDQLILAESDILSGWRLFV